MSFTHSGLGWLVVGLSVTIIEIVVGLCSCCSIHPSIGDSDQHSRELDIIAQPSAFDEVFADNYYYSFHDASDS